MSWEDIENIAKDIKQSEGILKNISNHMNNKSCYCKLYLKFEGYKYDTLKEYLYRIQLLVNVHIILVILYSFLLKYIGFLLDFELFLTLNFVFVASVLAYIYFGFRKDFIYEEKKYKVDVYEKRILCSYTFLEIIFLFVYSLTIWNAQSIPLIYYEPIPIFVKLLTIIFIVVIEYCVTSLNIYKSIKLLDKELNKITLYKVSCGNCITCKESTIKNVRIKIVNNNQSANTETIIDLNKNKIVITPNNLIYIKENSKPLYKSKKYELTDSVIFYLGDKAITKDNINNFFGK